MQSNCCSCRQYSKGQPALVSVGPQLPKACSVVDAIFKKLCISQCFLISVCSSSVTFCRDASSLHRSSQEPGSSPQDVGIVPLEAIPQGMSSALVIHVLVLSGRNMSVS